MRRVPMIHRCMYLSFALFCLACGGGGSSNGGGAGARAGESGAAVSGSGGSDAGDVLDAGSTQPDSGGVCTYVPGNAPANCPNDLPATCPPTVPSYKDDVAPVIGAYCAPCHRSGGLAPDKPFGTYAQVYKLRTDIEGRVSSCIMPPSCAPQPKPAERAAFLAWLVCSAPNN